MELRQRPTLAPDELRLTTIESESRRGKPRYRLPWWALNPPKPPNTLEGNALLVNWCLSFRGEPSLLEGLFSVGIICRPSTQKGLVFPMESRAVFPKRPTEKGVGIMLSRGKPSMGNHPPVWPQENHRLPPT